MLSKQDKERLTVAERDYWKDEKMVKHCVGKTQSIFDLRGKIVIIEKHSIETDFPFGYGVWDGTPDEAAAMAAHAQSNELYFLRKNHERAGYSEEINLINDGRYIVYALPKYCGRQSILYDICYISRGEYECKGVLENSFILTNAEIQAYKKALAEAAKEHHKKLTAYLKRYGLSKVNSWTYWADE